MSAEFIYVTNKSYSKMSTVSEEVKQYNKISENEQCVRDVFIKM